MGIILLKLRFDTTMLLEAVRENIGLLYMISLSAPYWLQCQHRNYLLETNARLTFVINLWRLIDSRTISYSSSFPNSFFFSKFDFAYFVIFMVFKMLFNIHLFYFLGSCVLDQVCIWVFFLILRWNILDFNVIIFGGEKKYTLFTGFAKNVCLKGCSIFFNVI